MIALVTDSTAYFTKRESEEWGVRVVPMSYTVGGRIFHETYWDKNGDYETLLRDYISQARTSQSSVSAFMSAFDELIRQGYDVLCITISSRLSGTYSSATVAARELGKGRVEVLDSRLTAGGMHMLVKQARRLIDAGKSLPEIMDELIRVRDRISIAFSVSDLTQLRKSGRLGVIRQSVSTILNNKPLFLCVEGTVVSDGMARGHSDQMQRLLKRVPPGTPEIVVHYTRQEERSARALLESLAQSHPDADIMCRALGPVLTIHLGLSVLGIAFRRE